MNLLNVCFGIITVASFCFALWQYHKIKINEKVELGKIAVSTQRIKQAYNTIHNIAYVADMIVQRSKSENEISISELQNLARVIRGQAFILIEELSSEHSKMKNWKYGEMVQSEGLDEKTVGEHQIEEPPKDA